MLYFDDFTQDSRLIIKWTFEKVFKFQLNFNENKANLKPLLICLGTHHKDIFAIFCSFKLLIRYFSIVKLLVQPSVGTLILKPRDSEPF